MPLHTLRRFLDFVFINARSENPASQRQVVANQNVENYGSIFAGVANAGYKFLDFVFIKPDRKTERQVESYGSIFVIKPKASFIAIETLNSANYSASLALESIFVLNRFLYLETCNISLLLFSRFFA